DALCLVDAEGVDCLPNEEIFAELARMGYEKPSTKLTFYKAFFLSQWKFLIHTILQCMSAKRTSWNEFSSSMVSAVISLSLGDLSTHTTIYTSPALTQKVFANIRRVGKGFFGVETPLFEGMLVEQQGDEEGDANEHVEEVNIGDDAKGDDSAAHGEIPTVAVEQSIPSPTPPNPPPQPPQDIPSTLQVQQTPPQSHQEGEETKEKEQGESVEAKKVAKGWNISEDDKEENKEVADAVKDVEEVKVDESAQVQGRQAESQAEIYKIDMDHANKVLSMQEDKTKPTEVQEVVDVVTTVKLITKVVTAASETVTAASVIITTDVEDLKRHLQIVPNKDDDVYTEATPLARKVPVVDYEIIEMNNKPYYKIIRADGTYQLYISFLTLLRNFDREDLKALWSLVMERFSTSKPKNCSDDFLLTTLDHNLYNHIADFVSGKDVPTLKIYSKPDVECYLIARPPASLKDLFTQTHNFIWAEDANNEDRLREPRQGNYLTKQHATYKDLSRRPKDKFVSRVATRASSPYNVILGRLTMRQRGSIASTLHSIMKFPTQEGIAIIRGETPHPICNQISRKRDRTFEEKKVSDEENNEEKIVINEAYPEQKVTIGKNLPRKLKQQLFELLCCNIDIFAWTPTYMTSIPCDIAEQMLNIHPWSTKAEASFQELKNHLKSLPTLTTPKPEENLTLYIVAVNEAITAVLLTGRGGVEKPVYFISRALQGPKIDYPILEKVTLALVHAARRLRHSFQAHKICVLTDQPIRQVLLKPENSGRLAKWAIELGEHKII
nr:protein NYNRIN-like [Tanacetum cinerariifolium]